MKNFPTPGRRLEETAQSATQKLVIHKNAMLADLENVRRQKTPNPTVVRSLALEVAVLEEKIADALIEEKKGDQAPANLISAASCWVEAGKKTDALRALDRARELSTNNEAMQRWIRNYEKQVQQKV